MQPKEKKDNATANGRGKGFGLLFQMGCGKTLTAIAIAGVLYQNKAIDRLLVVAPTSVVPVWSNDLSTDAAFRFTCRTLTGAKDRRLKCLLDLKRYPFDGLRVAVINYEGLRVDGMLDALLEWSPDMVICDESQRIKSNKAAQSKAAHKLGDAAKYKLILTGTPIQNNAMDFWSQYRFLDPTVFGTNFYRFQGRYGIKGGFNDKQIVGYRDLDDLMRRAHSIASRVTMEEAIDLPGQVFQTRVVQFSSEQRSLYNKLKRDSFVELSNGGEVTVTTALTKLLRLQQLTGGILQKDDAAEPTWVGSPKIAELKEIVQDLVLEQNQKLVIFARFIPEVGAISDMLSDVLSGTGRTFVTLQGSTPQDERGTVVQRFQENPRTMVFVGQIDTAGTGITLTAAHTTVYYSKTFNYATYEQSLFRTYRIGQKHPCLYIDLLCEGTVDKKLNDALTKKKNLSDVVVNDWRTCFE